MLNRAMDLHDDYTFCSGTSFFYNNSPQAVAQAIKTSLRLLLGEWFLDNTIGVPYATEVLGNNTQATRDPCIKNAILQVTGVESIVDYNSNFYGPTRTFTVTVTVLTIYSQQPITVEVTL